jgi:hypothetical protein
MDYLKIASQKDIIHYSIVPAFQLERNYQLEKGVTKLEEKKI